MIDETTKDLPVESESTFKNVSVADQPIEVKRTRPSQFNYDFRVFTEDGTFDFDKSLELEEVSKLRRALRRAKTPHFCRLIPEDTLHPDMLPSVLSRPYRRYIERKIRKQKARKNAECHPVRQMKPGGAKWRRILRQLSKGR